MDGSPNSERYKEAGVDIAAGEEFVRRITPLIAKTRRPEVRGGIGHYGSLFAWGSEGGKPGFLVASTDGVGTKVTLAQKTGCWQGLGEDLVAMCANDILCLGAEPLFFLDYLATSRLEIDWATQIVTGMTSACQQIGCALVGGETAEMPTLYRSGDFDLAGFIVGWVAEGRLIDGSQITPGDRVVGLSSTGFHANGYSLLLKIIADHRLDLDQPFGDTHEPLGTSLSRPTQLYGPIVLNWLHRYTIHGLAHITGGGLVGNLPRILPPTCRLELHRRQWQRPGLFSEIQRLGRISEKEMLTVFNDGIGMVLILPERDARPLLAENLPAGVSAWELGRVISRSRGSAAIEIS